MKALILAAGQGTRLRPLTDSIPKCLVKLLGQPLLLRQADVLRACGIDDISVATGYEAQQIADLGFDTYYNENYMTTNMVESLFCSREIFSEEQDLIVAYGDIVYSKENLRKLMASEASIAVIVDNAWRDLWSSRMDNPLTDAETLKLDASGHILELGQRPNSYDDIEGQYTGLIKVSADFIKEFAEFYDCLDRNAKYEGRDFEQMYMTSFLQMLIDEGVKVEATIVNRGWLEVDSVEDLSAYEAMHKSGQLDEFIKL